MKIDAGTAHIKRKNGSQSAGEIYASVGQALSWWEGSEDVLLMLFRDIVGHVEFVSVETFKIAPRDSRNRMILSGVKHYGASLTREETEAIKRLLKTLDGLAKMRNQIAHGFVVNISEKIEDEITMQGNFLVPSITLTGQFTERTNNWKYAYTAAEIDEWREKVRDSRFELMNISLAISQRKKIIHRI